MNVRVSLPSAAKRIRVPGGVSSDLMTVHGFDPARVFGSWAVSPTGRTKRNKTASRGVCMTIPRGITGATQQVRDRNRPGARRSRRLPLRGRSLLLGEFGFLLVF